MAETPKTVEDLVRLCKSRKDRLTSIKKKDIEDIMLALPDDTTGGASTHDLKDWMSKILQEMQELRQENKMLLSALDRLGAVEKEMTELKVKNSDLQGQVSKMCEVVAKQQSELEMMESKARGKNLLMFGVPEGRFLDTNIEKEKAVKILQIVDRTEEGNYITSMKRLGETTAGKIRPLLITVHSQEKRDHLVKAARDTEAGLLQGTKLKKDTPPSIRAEWTRLFDVKKQEEEKPENAGKVFTMDMRKRQVLCEGQVIDSWRSQNFF